VYNLPPTTTIERISGLFTKTLQQKLVTIQEETDVVKITGYIGKPENAKKRRGDQYFFVNNRFIKSPYLHHAVAEAYRDLISNDSHPAYYLFLDVNPQTIDINIHPTKTEIKFQDEKIIYALLHSSVKRALGKANVAPSLDFNSEMSFEIDYTKQVSQPTVSFNPNYNPFESNVKSANNYKQTAETALQKHNKENWQSLYDNYTQSPELIDQEKFDIEKPLEQKQLFSENSFQKKFQIYNRFIVCAHENGVLVVDQQRAHEQILYEHYKSVKDSNSSTACQQILFPITIEVTPNDFILINSLNDYFVVLGFEIEAFGKNTIIVRGTPAELGEFNIQEMIESILESYKLNTFDVKMDPFENLCKSMAKSAAIKYGKQLEEEEMTMILENLFHC